MASEAPALGKTFLLSYVDNNVSRPVLAVPKDPTKPSYRQEIPTIGTATGLSVEYQAAYPSHKFRWIQIVQPDQLVYWIYEQLPGVVYTEYDQDEETLGLITTDYQVVARSAVTAPTEVPGQITTYKKIDDQHFMKIVRTISLPTTFTEQRIAAHTFPALFNYLSYFWSDDCGAFSQIRSALSAQVKTVATISFTSTVQSFTPLTLLPRSLMLGKGFQIHEDVLVDAGTYFYTGVCTDSVSFDASVPSYSDYLASIQNTLQILAGESVQWKARLYRNTKVEAIYL